MNPLTLAAVLCLAQAPSSPADELRVLPPGADTLLATALKQQAFAAIDHRLAAYEKLKTPDHCRAWQDERRRFFLEHIGGLAAKTPLNPRVTGVIDEPDYRIEKLLIESQPGFHVTANLYLPKNATPPLPTVIVACGHGQNGKAGEGYQRMSILAAKHGFAAICFDPVSQGERYQTLRVTGRPGNAGSRKDPRLDAVRALTPEARINYNPVEEHQLIGTSCVPLGWNTARFRIWDAMCIVDYLQSRPDIDPKRIGVTGTSGGGTESAYLAALDDRIAAAAPGCFLTSFRRLLETASPMDSEQTIHAELTLMDEADFPILAAPRPVCILAGTRDKTFDILGTWDTYRQAQRFYARLGSPQKMAIIEADEPHGFGKPLRVAALRWFQRWLQHKDTTDDEPDFPIHTDAQLLCTPRGQVLLMDGERSAFDLTAAELTRLQQQREQRRESVSPEQLRQNIATLLAPDGGSAAIEVRGPDKTIDRGDYTVQLYTTNRPGSVPTPLASFALKNKPSHDVVVYVHSGGKAADAAVGGPIEQLVRQGKLVLAIDLTGIGETAAAPWAYKWAGDLFGPDVPEWGAAYLLGRSLVGMRTSDIITAARPFQSAARRAGGKFQLIATGSAAAIPALHAAAHQPELFDTVEIRRCVRSWADVVRTAVPEDQLTSSVHGSLRLYDLPDLIQLCGNDKVKIVDPVDPQNKPLK